VKKYCRFCEKDSHSEDNCFSIERIERKLKAMKTKVNKVQEDKNTPAQNAPSSKN
jgi:hypothetical protein